MTAASSHLQFQASPHSSHIFSTFAASAEDFAKQESERERERDACCCIQQPATEERLSLIQGEQHFLLKVCTLLATVQ